MLFSLFCWIVGSKDGKTAFLACGSRQVLALDGKKATSGEKQRVVVCMKGLVMTPGSPEMDNHVLTFTQEVSRAICWREEAAYLLPDGNPNPVLGLAGSGEDSIGKVLEGKVGVWSHRDPRHLVEKVFLQELQRGGAATGDATAMQLPGGKPVQQLSRLTT